MRIHIQEPCHENWEKMKLGLVSRHCESCQKEVVDFTKKSRSEIIIHLLSNPNENICGRMYGDQFDFHHNDIPLLVEALKKRPSNSSFLIFALVCLNLVACGSENSTIKPNKVVSTSMELYQNPDDTSHTTKGEIGLSVEKPTNKKIIKPHKMTVDPIDEPVLVGEIGLEDPREQVQGMVVCEPPAPEFEQKRAPEKFAEVMPEYVGGLSEMVKFIENNTVYPVAEREKNIQGTVYARVIINRDGAVSNPSILKGIKDHPDFDQEAMRVIGLMPHWKPGLNRGVPVDVEYTLPIQFK
jgi:TonB family protein